jgi:hypothetical protein
VIVSCGLLLIGAKPAQYIASILPLMVSPTQYHGMATPGIGIELCHGWDTMSPYRIEVNIAEEFLEISIFFTDDGFIPVLEKMTMSLVSMIIVDGIPGQKSSHEVR